MKEKQCELVRRELDGLEALNEELGTATAEHLEACADCREFERQQRKLRQIVGSLGTVNAPADFDFRLRARLAADSHGATFRYWSFAVKSLATAAVLGAFAFGAFVVWQRAQQPRQEPAVVVTPPQQRPVVPPAVKPVESPKAAVPVVAENKPTLSNRHLTPQTLQASSKQKRSLVAVDFSSERAEVERKTRTLAVFPIEASSQSLTVSLDDGRGNARTVSFPGISFGSQRVPATGNQFAPKNIW